MRGWVCPNFTVIKEVSRTMSENHSATELATFAGGCFWCMVHPFDELPGILKVVSGYTGGHKLLG